MSYKPEYITEIQKKGIKRAELRLDSGAQGKLLVRKSVLTHPDLLSVLAHPDLLRILTLDKYFFFLSSATRLSSRLVNGVCNTVRFVWV